MHVSFMDRTSKSICGSYCVRCIDDKLLILEPVCDAYELVDNGNNCCTHSIYLHVTKLEYQFRATLVNGFVGE